jgi:hypothetical protein
VYTITHTRQRPVPRRGVQLAGILVQQGGCSLLRLWCTVGIHAARVRRPTYTANIILRWPAGSAQRMGGYIVYIQPHQVGPPHPTQPAYIAGTCMEGRPIRRWKGAVRQPGCWLQVGGISSTHHVERCRSVGARPAPLDGMTQHPAAPSRSHSSHLILPLSHTSTHTHAHWKHTATHRACTQALPCCP